MTSMPSGKMKRPTKAELIVALECAVRLYQSARVRSNATEDDRNFCERLLARLGRHTIQ